MAKFPTDAKVVVCGAYQKPKQADLWGLERFPSRQEKFRIVSRYLIRIILFLILMMIPELSRNELSVKFDFGSLNYQSQYRYLAALELNSHYR